jgi:hypothetical protein
MASRCRCVNKPASAAILPTSSVGAVSSGLSEAAPPLMVGAETVPCVIPARPFHSACSSLEYRGAKVQRAGNT